MSSERTERMEMAADRIAELEAERDALAAQVAAIQYAKTTEDVAALPAGGWAAVGVDLLKEVIAAGAENVSLRQELASATQGRDNMKAMWGHACDDASELKSEVTRLRDVRGACASAAGERWLDAQLTLANALNGEYPPTAEPAEAPRTSTEVSPGLHVVDDSRSIWTGEEAS